MPGPADQPDPQPDAQPDPQEVVRRRLAGHDPAAGHDTGGVPWAGRDLHETPFSGDTGEADPRVAAALDGPDAELLAALVGARVFVAVVAMPTHVERSAATGLVSDANSDMATVVLTAPDGERALPAFTGIASLAAWDPAARPVPVTVQAAAQAAIEEGCQVMVLDVAGRSRVVRSSGLWALAQGRPWVHAAHDPVVRAAVDDAARGLADLHGVELAEGAHGSLVVTLVLRPGLPADRVSAASQAVAGALGADDVRIRLDDVRMALLRAG